MTTALFLSNWENCTTLLLNVNWTSLCFIKSDNNDLSYLENSPYSLRLSRYVLQDNFEMWLKELNYYIANKFYYQTANEIELTSNSYLPEVINISSIK